jgi:hypothetical protein
MEVSMKSKSSEKKIAANRENARRSTGPKTKLGKSRTKNNALTHGVYATNSLIPGEDAELYEAIKSEQRSIFKPKTFIEKALVDQLIKDLWNLRRIAKAEHRHLVAKQNQVHEMNMRAIAAHQKEILINARDPNNKSTHEENWNMLENFKKEITGTHLVATYESLFVFDPDGYMQKLVLMKRHVLQSILSIERELERRLNRRRIKKSFPDQDYK